VLFISGVYHYNNNAFDTDYPDSLPPMGGGSRAPETSFSNWSMGGPQLRKVSPPSLPDQHRDNSRHSMTSPMKGGNPIDTYQVNQLQVGHSFFIC
jgi:hypothetical protein